uniref:Glutaconate CoA-transferase, subunit A n=2 Tax=Candidatus Bipolaricaulota TaxID=67810 RepID=H5SHE3_9BACT|nr:glutaconate CoA-transferase, subunit A [uncultured Acetothermia bacterium]BAL58925.1 glutaconate CoA-transferase, subunit A [Candidatus Acetothermum autotrophicum]
MEIIESGQKELLQPPDVEEFRRWMRENKSPALRDKVMDEHEAVKRFIKDGDYIGVELYGTVRCPMSIIREIVRQGKKRLRLAGQGLLEIDFLVAAGLVEAMDITYVGYEVLGLSNILRRAAEGGKIKLVEWSNAAMAWRFKAAAMGVPFIPVRSMLGTDTLRYSSAKVVKDPFTGIPVTLLPALILDVGIIHVHRADKYGNAQIDGISGFAFEMARASKRLIISTEELIPTEEIQRYPERTIIPWFLVDAVVVAPFGSHPGEMCYCYERDQEHLLEFLKAAETEETTQQYLQKYVYGPKTHQEYLDLIGRDRLEALKRACKGR